MSPLNFQSHDPMSGAARGWTSRAQHSELQVFFIRRLSRLLRLRRDCSNLIDADDWHIRLLRRSIYATYCECLELGVSEQARRLLTENQLSAANE